MGCHRSTVTQRPARGSTRTSSRPCPGRKRPRCIGSPCRSHAILFSPRTSFRRLRACPRARWAVPRGGRARELAQAHPFNLAIDRSRRHGRELPVDEVEESWRDDAYTVDSQAVVEQAETREELEDALIRLPCIYRSAVVLHDVEGLTASEIADAQDIGLASAKQRLRGGG